MKKISLTLIGLYIICLYNISYGSYTGDIASDIRVVGEVDDSGNSSLGNGGKLVFPDSNEGVHINTNNYSDTADSSGNSGTDDLEIYGDFWLYDTSDNSNPESGWATFDIGTVTGAPEVTLDNNLDNTFTFNGYAWSNAAGWIYFGDTGVAGGEVIYDRGTGKINGCAWSQNLGWICLDFELDTTPPDIDNPSITNVLTTTAANHLKTFTLPEEGTLEIENYWNSGRFEHLPAATTFNNIDIRAAKDYYIKVTDTSGNSSEGILTVVSNEPSNILIPGWTGDGGSASTFTDNSSSDKYSDGTDRHNIEIRLRDSYGNIISNVGGIKDVEVFLGISNNVDKNQIINNDSGDAIDYNFNNFGINIPLGGYEGGTGSTGDGIYEISFSSFAPTKAGYSFTSNNNDIHIQDLDITITTLNGNSGVGEGSFDENDIGGTIGNDYKFTPLVKVTGITSSGEIIRDYETGLKTTVEVSNKLNPSNIENLRIRNIFDIMSGATAKNNELSMQSFTGLNITTGGPTHTNSEIYCESYNKANDDNTSYSFYHPTGLIECDELSSESSNISTRLGNITSGTGDIFINYKSTPKVVSSGINKFSLDYSSNIYYRLSSEDILYPSYNSSSINNIDNNEIIINGIVNKGDNNFSVLEDTPINYIGNMSKSEAYRNIHKNISTYQSNSEKTGQADYEIGKIKYISSGDYTLSGASDPRSIGIDTIIVYGNDIIIGNDITKNTFIKSIIVLQDENGNGGNIFIDKNVQKIYAILVADKSIISGDKTSYYSDNRGATNQLYINGAIVSNNTIGGASKVNLRCPYYIDKNSCDYDIAKRYDFNHFRQFVLDSGVGILNWAGIDKKQGYDNAPLIIEYDSRIKTSTPKLFIN